VRRPRDEGDVLQKMFGIIGLDWEIKAFEVKQLPSSGDLAPLRRIFSGESRQLSDERLIQIARRILRFGAAQRENA
jgi:hypothetical protein